MEQIHVNSSVTEDFEQFLQEIGAEYPRVGDVTREIDAFTREFGANTRELTHLLVSLKQILVN
jgi:hypothetical protein